ncbi:response regulator [Virgisporangium aliadipatigenens]|uniref:Response regulator n=1 Tax=Virgisporangium aliadipatigenens TaxID=741659 RepID=A0A8J4DQU5_9ACTN|nr:response regulator [Virgisporangium aliadipatigenens]GIJ46959.1 response regulator [Virgisporangium aliadipatigenens]
MSPTEVLIVEDNPDDLELALHALRKSDFANAVEVARDGAEALDLLLKTGAELPKVILLDVKLPLVDGIEVLRELKKDARTRRVPVVMMTSSAEDRDLAAAYELGANSYIVKPVDIDQFYRAVQQVGKYWLMLNQGEPWRTR